MTVQPEQLCRTCHRPIRLTPMGWGHVTAYRIGVLHPLHRARP